MRFAALLLLFVGLAPGGVRAQDAILDPLPVPLKVPPGLVQTLPINKTASFFGEAIYAVDCPEGKDLPFGTCGNELFGGLVMGDSHLSGNITIRFSPPVGNIAHFQVTHGVLPGEDAVLQAPQGYELALLEASVTDAPGLISEGDLDLTTGGVTNLKYYVIFKDTALTTLHNVNPKLAPLVLEFPGQRGSVWARFEQRADGLLDFSFRGTTFLPLGGEIGGEPVRFPMPFCNPAFQCASILSRGTSFHPHLYLSTKEPEGPECGLNCPEIPVNTVREFTLFTHSSSFGDDFSLDIPQLGGPGPGRSHLLGRLQIQFGPRSGDTVPFFIRGLVPEGLLAKPPPSTLLVPGMLPGLLGQDEFLRFPLLTYRLKRVAVVDEPFDLQHGAVNLKTGRVIGEMVYPSFFGTNIAEVLFRQNEGRISTLPFLVVALKQVAEGPAPTYALFERSPNGATVFRYSGVHKRSFANFLFPTPELVRDKSFVGGPAAVLNLFMRLQAIHTPEPPRVRKIGGAVNVLSSLGDLFSFNYSIPCDPAGAEFSFEYTNQNPGSSGGTFRMTRLAAVNCMNSRTSVLGPSDADTITFSGFGTWSKDKADSPPRFATVQISTSSGAPYVGILVFQLPDAELNVVLSSANTRPAENPLP